MRSALVGIVMMVLAGPAMAQQPAPADEPVDVQAEVENLQIQLASVADREGQCLAQGFHCFIESYDPRQ